MGDGCIDSAGKNPLLYCKMITLEYLEYLKKEFGIMMQEVKLYKTGIDIAEIQERRGINFPKENYNDQYYIRTVSHPELHTYREWYNSGKKVWPDDIELTPTVLKHWYCGDGSYDKTVGRIEISLANEIDNLEKVENYFIQMGLPLPRWSINDRNMFDGISCKAVWTVEDSKILWDYMGEPLPGFEYKWP